MGTSPDYAFEVLGTIAQQEGSVRNTIVSNGTGFEFTANATALNVGRSFTFSSSASGGSMQEHMRIDSVGRVLIGGQTTVPMGGTNFAVQLQGSDFATTSNVIQRYGDSSAGGMFAFAKSRNATIGSQTIVQDNDQLGKIRWYGSNGSNFTYYAAEIAADVDGAPSSGADMPGRIVFSTTADGAGSPTERMRIDSNGVLMVGVQSTTLPTPGIDLISSGIISIQDSGGASRNILAFSSGVVQHGAAGGGVDAQTFSTSNVEAMRIDSSQRVLIGMNVAQTNASITARLELAGTTSSDSAIAPMRFSADGGAPSIRFAKSRATGITASRAIVQDGDPLGSINWSADDGTDLNSQAAFILASIDGTPGVNDTPGRLTFHTASDGNGYGTERMRISASGRVGINTVGESGAPTGWLTIDNDINSADVLTNKSSYHLVLGLDGGVTNHYIGGIGFGDMVTSTVQAAITAVDAGSSAATSLAFATGNTSAVNEAMRIDSSQRVLIGTTSSFADSNSDDLQISGSGDTGMIIKSGTSSFGSIYFGDGTTGDARNEGIVRYNHSNNSMEIWTSAVKRMGINNVGGVAIGTGTGNKINSGFFETSLPFCVNTTNSSSYTNTKQCFTGEITAGASAAWKDIARVDATNSLSIFVIALDGAPSVGSGVLRSDLVTPYGSGLIDNKISNTTGTISQISVRYLNSAGTTGTNYVLQVQVTYSGSAPTVRYTVEGMSTGQIYDPN